MAALATTVRTARFVQNITKLLTNVTISQNPAIKLPSLCSSSGLCVRVTSLGIHTTARKNGLMEFFDDEKNWGTQRIKVGRSWKLDELRIKSNEDLHKLWYILLKEKNMLLTMEHECNTEYEFFPNPERLDKVEDSMDNLETVVRERNRAYYELETGEPGERPSKWVRNQLGLYSRYKMRQHIIPKMMNRRWRMNNIHSFGGNAVAKFLNKYREKLLLMKLRKQWSSETRAKGILRRFPNVNMDALKARYPLVDVEKIKNHKEARGHFLPK